MWSSKGGPSNRWSLCHATLNDTTTVCGRKIPDAFNYEHGGLGDKCAKCEKKLPAEAASVGHDPAEGVVVGGLRSGS